LHIAPVEDKTEDGEACFPELFLMFQQVLWLAKIFKQPTNNFSTNFAKSKQLQSFFCLDKKAQKKSISFHIIYAT